MSGHNYTFSIPISQPCARQHFRHHHILTRSLQFVYGLVGVSSRSRGYVYTHLCFIAPPVSYCYTNTEGDDVNFKFNIYRRNLYKSTLKHINNIYYYQSWKTLMFFIFNYYVSVCVLISWCCVYSFFRIWCFCLVLDLNIKSLGSWSGLALNHWALVLTSMDWT